MAAFRPSTKIRIENQNRNQNHVKSVLASERTFPKTEQEKALSCQNLELINSLETNQGKNNDIPLFLQVRNPRLSRNP